MSWQHLDEETAHHTGADALPLSSDLVVPERAARLIQRLCARTAYGWSVSTGTPDDYVMRFLPNIMARFAQSHSMIQVELHCEPSYQLLQRKDLDLTIVTHKPSTEIGQLLRQEKMVWAQAAATGRSGDAATRH